jgi:S-adenosylmethionine-diacylgycerolhomoserine-N-methlytransferase
MTRSLRRYYRFHAKIYDATRWSFLFGRSALIDLLCADCRPYRVLEIGCGTGKNLAVLAERFPEADLCGVDLSGDMLQIAEKRLQGVKARTRLVHAAYDLPIDPGRPFDLVVFSYTLSMINPGWSHAIRCAAVDLAPGGSIAVLDFHDSSSAAFKSWMHVNHVRMDSHLLPELSLSFRPTRSEVRGAYGGMWRYFLYLGKNV